MLFTGELFARALVRRLAMRVAEEAAKPPMAQRRLGNSIGEQRAASQFSGPQEAGSGWVEDAVVASPLWWLMPQGLPGFPGGRLPRA